MKVIGIDGSARRNGNTSTLIQKVFGVLEGHGIECEEINVGASPVRGCTACGKCYENRDGHCVMKNDYINEIINKIMEADALILGSPIYCADISGQMKNFIDRVSNVACANNDMFQRKLGASVIAVRRGGGIHGFHTLNSFFGICQMITVGSSYWNIGFGHEKGEVLEDKEGIQTMEHLGENMAWLLKVIEASKDKVSEPNNIVEVLSNFNREIGL